MTWSADARAQRRLGGYEIAEELECARPPRACEGVCADRVAIERQGGERCDAQIGVHHARHALSDDIDRTRDRVGRDRHAAGHRLEHHETEGVGSAREHEDARVRELSRQRFAAQRAVEHGLRISPL